MLGAILGLVLIRLLREPMRGAADLEMGTPAANAPAGLASTLSLRTMRSLAMNRSLLTLTGVFACANFVAMVLLAWMPMFLYSKFHLSLGIAAFDAAVYPQIASMAESFCGGYCADLFAQHTRRGRVLVQCGGVILAAPFVLTCGLSGSLRTVIFALIGWGSSKGSTTRISSRPHST